MTSFEQNYKSIQDCHTNPTTIRGATCSNTQGNFQHSTATSYGTSNTQQTCTQHSKEYDSNSCDMIVTDAAKSCTKENLASTPSLC